MTQITQPEIYNPYQKNFTLTTDAQNYEKLGIQLLQNSSFAVIILAGGQGTRLGYKNPKGCYVLPQINTSIFELHCIALLKAQKMYNFRLKLILMTSTHTHDHIVEFFHKNNNFSLENVSFFKQSGSTCVDSKNNPIQYFDKYASAPNGNGGIFEALHKQNVFDKISDCSFVNIISVDNVLARAVDPVAIGYLYKNNMQVLNKGVLKLTNESVGVFVNIDGKLGVKEYSELSETLSFDSMYGNICNHLFTTQFLKEVPYEKMPVHRAFKKIKYTDSKNNVISPEEPNGYKLEYFIFDCLMFAEVSGVLAVPREIEFAPVKNSVAEKCDNPETAVEALKNRNSVFKKMSDIPLDTHISADGKLELLIYNELETYEDVQKR